MSISVLMALTNGAYIMMPATACVNRTNEKQNFLCHFPFSPFREFRGRNAYKADGTPDDTIAACRQKIANVFKG